MFCKYCGKELKDGSKYCMYCGGKIVTETEDSIRSEGYREPERIEAGDIKIGGTGSKTEQSQPQPAHHSSKRKKAGAAAAVCLLLAAAGGAAAVVHTAKKKEAETIEIGGTEYDLQNVRQQEITEAAEREETIDLYAVTHQPSARDLSKKWDKQLFYWLEDTDAASADDHYLAQCRLSRTSLKRKDNGNEIDYEVYRDPKDGTIYKIISSERLADGTLELTDYYYKDGKPNFIFRRTDTVYTPTYASIDITGERFYFEDDQMVKWRWIYEPQAVKQWILELEDTWYTQWAYSDISEDERRQFDEKEAEMLNAAYNTLEAMERATGEAVLEGAVVDLEGKPLEEVWVAVGDMESGELLVKMQTGTDGRYAWKPEDDGTYFLAFKKEGYEDTVMRLVWDAQSSGQKQEDMILWEKDTEKSRVAFSVYQMTEEDADSQKADEQELRNLEEAEISIYPGLYYTEGEPIETIRSEASGSAEVSLKPGMYTVKVKKEGFITLVTKVLVRDSEERVSLYCMEEAKEKPPVWTVVLTWEGAEKNGADLDATMFIPQKGAAGNMRYLNTRNREDGKGNRFLYDGGGTTACEVLELKQPEPGSYKYYVNDYSYALGQDGNPEGLSESNGTVQVYKDGVFVQEFSVPSGASGDIWEVFEIQNGELIPIQKLYAGGAEEGWWIQDKSRREWVEENGAWRYYSPTGLMETSKWLESDGSWYYLDEQGVMAGNGWKEIDGNQYYFGEDGAMYANQTTPDGYYVGEDGVWREFTERQQEIVKRILSEELYRGLEGWNQYVEKTERRIAVSEFGDERLTEMIWPLVDDYWLSGLLKEQGIDITAKENTYGNLNPYSNYMCYEKSELEDVIGDIYGRVPDWKDGESYQDDFYYIFDDKIFVMGATPDYYGTADIAAYSFEGNTLTVQGSYRTENDYVGILNRWEYSAVFQINPDSFFGLTLVSYEAQYTSAPNALADRVAPYAADGEEWGSMESPSAPTALMDMGTYYKLSNWKIEQETDNGTPMWSYQGDIHIPKDAKFEYIAAKYVYYGESYSPNEYVSFENLSFAEYLSYVEGQQIPWGNQLQIFFDGNGNIIGGRSDIAG